ncbi:DEAD/DEAH box helicase [Fructobacillus ficulneus]|uniref:DEAD-box ATP-dependent RNA helicase CshB n=1 Tax=Fructobacillus ficulneus TaxID=157463 RepID=A0A0K8MHL3_9LACO|nr:DEAD/DEAH box helicase [Fructobacillus ficulneus]GAP00036.1 ATP-dependent RNA helicase/auto aggregation-mediating protein [Fructobacillus ficulneus]
MTSSNQQFGEYNLKPEVLAALKAIGFDQPTPIQARLIPTILRGGDVVGQSQTGSGKTHTFLVPIFNALKPELAQTQVVIATPSRELAAQIAKAAREFAEKMELVKVSIAEYVGGTDKARQIRQLEKHQAQIVIGTPGRLKDLVQTGALVVNQVRTLVVDEADMTMDMGFLNEVDFLAGAMPKDLQTLIFSATMPEKLKPFLKKYLSNPDFQTIPTEATIADTIDNWLVPTKSKNKEEVIDKLLSIFNPYLALIFTNTKERAKELAAHLRGRGLKVAEIHGDIPPRERRRVMKGVLNLDYQYVVATDLAARGIDIQGVSHVINDGVPDELEFFVHRVGRTGRNKMAGTAVTLYGPDEEDRIADLEKFGVTFAHKQIRGDEIVDVKDRKARVQRNATTNKLDPEMVGMVKKKKKNVKPGYKRQIKNKIKRKRQMDHRIEMRQDRRNTRRQNKEGND